jgi:hypothetical protein
MLRSEFPKSKLKFLSARSRAVFLGLCFACLFLTLLPSAMAQTDFTLQAAPFSPYAINPGGTASSNITIGGSSTTVDLSCTVSPQPTNFPDCQVSPATLTAPAGAVATITTALLSGTSPPGLYTVTITATDPSGSLSAQQNLTVLAVTPQFTITVQSVVAPSSVHAGSGGQGTIEINPINGYTGTVTLACASITPLVTIPPSCSFSPTPVPVNGVPATATISISTVGPKITQRIAPPGRIVFALWLPLPMLALTGIGAVIGGKRSRKAVGLLALFVLVASLLLVPACANNHIAVNDISAVTPNNTYTFTVIGVDSNGGTSSNTGTGTASPTVTLTVN